MVSIKLSTSSSFRAVSKTVSALCLCLNLDLCSPSYGTVLVWTKKVGVFCLRPPAEKTDDWVLIIDESISIGHERLLVVYGVRSGKIDFGRALTYTDLTPLLVKASNRWTSDIIKKEIEEITEKYGNVNYIVADGGSAITKAIRLLSKEHVYDITHKMAWLLKKMYGGDNRFVDYTKEMANARSRFTCTGLAHLAPPKQRADSRFMNLDILSDWGRKALNCLNNPGFPDKAFQGLKWVKDHEGLICELHSVNILARNIKTLIKTLGLSKDTLKKVTKMLREISPQNRCVGAGYFCEQIIQFLKETLKKLPQEKKVLCTSDIIESSFGKYKGYTSHNPMLGFTNLALCLAAFTNGLENEQLRIGLEMTSVNDLKSWTKKNIGDTNLSRRRRYLKLNGV